MFLMLAIVCFPQLLTVINRVCMAYEKRVPKVYVEILGSIIGSAVHEHANMRGDDVLDDM